LARRANQRAAALARGLSALPGVRLAWPAQANEVFAVLPKRRVEALRAAGAAFFDWYSESLPPEIRLKDDEAFVRLVASWSTEESAVDQFLAAARATA
jgi:threonine aldolase